MKLALTPRGIMLSRERSGRRIADSTFGVVNKADYYAVFTNPITPLVPKYVVKIDASLFYRITMRVYELFRSNSEKLIPVDAIILGEDTSQTQTNPFTIT